MSSLTHIYIRNFRIRKERFPIKSVSEVALVLAIFALVALPWAVSARSQGTKVTLAPTVVKSDNSQTMTLLEGHLNINPTGIGGPELAIVDQTAIEAGSDNGGAFVDLGQSGNGQISEYTVRDGDTLSSIAQMFGVSINTIVWANDIKGGKVAPGQDLVILPISGVRHIVKSGDTLQSIANKYKADINDILTYNDLAPDAKIKAGDVILVPDGEITAAQTLATKPSTHNSLVTAGYYLRPIVGGHKSQGIHGHNAVDLAVSLGTPIMASANGKVILAKVGGYNGGYGNYVIISHPNGTQTVYGHMNKVNVTVGQNVSQGEVIGTVGLTGNTTGPHVHFEIRGAVNPF